MPLIESERHSREFMLKAVERLEAGERASALAIELNLNRTIVHHWRGRFRANGAEVLAAQSVRASRARADGLVQARAQIAELERKVSQQQLDLDFFSDPLREETALRDVIQRLALANRHYGYLRIGALLGREGWCVQPQARGSAHA